MRRAGSGARMHPNSGSKSATQARTHRYFLVRSCVFMSTAGPRCGWPCRHSAPSEGSAAAELPNEAASIGVRSLSCSVRDEDVALVAYRPDEPRVLGIGLDLLAQAHDAQIDAPVERVPVSLLVEIQDAFARERPVGVLRKRLEQIELERGHRYLASVLVGESVCGEVEHAVSDAHLLGANVGTIRR